MADAAYAILSRPARQCSGNFFIDEEVLRAEGVSDFSMYAPHIGDALLQGDFFVPDAVYDRSPTRIRRGY
jgi:citronellol/citronellal dehydrogenase